MTTTDVPTKPLGGKAYGSIGHLPHSRLGPGDHSCPEGQSRICTTRARDKFDRIIVQEKLDGSCVSVARIDGAIVPLIRAGWPAATSKYRQHHLFAAWAYEHQDRFLALLRDGERLCGEWLAQAHGTRYDLPHGPFVAFDLMHGAMGRRPFDEFADRVGAAGFVMPRLIHAGPPLPTDAAIEAIEDRSHHGAIDPIEGVVYRVERKGAVEFLAKWVRPGKADGSYLPEVSGEDAVWNWLPGREG